ncbi:MAG: M48 family metalloprotease [Betaproteobacteria bacterium]|nr:M48 family metalloprotease [Betaproteobacteria bacterium]
MSEAQEISFGRNADAEVRKQYGVYKSAALQEYVNSVGQQIAKKSHRPNLQYHFTVLDTPEVNAFALPGGYVYITRGILAYLNSEAELAAVLGHEIGHVTARHGVRQASAELAANIGLSITSILVPEINSAAGQNLSNILGGALFAGYGRDHELEADRLGAEYLARTGYDPHAMIEVIDVLKHQELLDAEIARQEGREPRHYHGLFATHPDNDTRLQQAVGESSQLAVANPTEGYAQFLRQIDGLTFNESSEQGVVRNNKFMHVELGIALSFPQDWRVQNLPDKLLAVSQQGDAVIQLKMDKQSSGTPAGYARRLAGFGSNSRIETLDINGLPAALVTTPAAMAGVIYLNQSAYIIQCGVKSRAAFTAHRNDMLDTIHSFHALSETERRQARPLAIRLITARAGDTYANLAQHSPLGKTAENQLRLINGNYPQGEPVPGQYVKIVE